MKRSAARPARSGVFAPAGNMREADAADRLRSAMDLLKSAMQYKHNPAVRVEAIEALEAVGDEMAQAWIRSAALDPHPAVRYAAVMAMGRARDKVGTSAVERALGDEDANVRVAALFARHRLGQTDRTGEVTWYLLDHPEAGVRRNAALALGLLGESSAIKVLAKAMRDRDAGVRQHALEAMARLGNREAKQELAFMANTGVGSEEVFALTALMGSKDCSLIETYRYKLGTANHLETKLVAARGLGSCGADDGYSIAHQAMSREPEVREEKDDPAAAQVLRIRQLAALALGAIGREEAVPVLEKALGETTDPRLQVCLARAVVEIMQRGRTANAAGR